MTAPAIRLGAFQLQIALAKGGQGEVWRASHGPHETPVAVKIVTAEDLHHPSLVAALEAEIRAVAALDHPHVIRMFDAGRVGAEAAAASGGAFAEGAPWFAMELVGGGTLNELHEPGWPVIRDVLLDLLDALAHAHARGVVHRDLKTANVLFRPDGHLVLTDFGMAYALRRHTQATPAAGGTPLWMAPEQFTGGFAHQGPWTDLYALGCLAWALACRRAPFRGRSWVRLMKAHLEEPLPRLKPVVEVPDALEPWLRRMTAKQPRDRYRRAADAAWALASMGRRVRARRRFVHPDDPESERSEGGVLPPTEAPTLFLPSTPDVAPARAVTPPSQMARLRAPQMPPNWRRPHGAAPVAPPPGVGLGLWGLRDVPMVGRLRERDALWSALSQVHHRRRASAVVLRGPAGVGKTRLARWFLRRAHETGAATPLRATHNPTTAPSDGLAGLLARAVRAAPGEAVDDLRARLDDLPEAALDRLMELLSPPETPGSLATPEDRFGLFADLIPRLCEGRPALVFVEDVQWGLPMLELVRWVLDRPVSPSVLFVVAARDDALRDAAEAEAEVEALEHRPDVLSLPLGPLGQGDRLELVGALIGLDRTLASEVDRRAGGNPLFAVQLVGDWVARGVLHPGPDGFALAEGVDTQVPETVGALWRARLRRVLDEGPPSWETGLYVAALLGMEVRSDEWRDACAAAGIEAPLPLQLRLLAERLAATEPGSLGGRWSFAHGMLRETVEGMARDAGDVARLHRACAQMLAAQGPAAAARRARHLMAAEDWPEAAEVLEEAASYHHHRDSPTARWALLRKLEVLDRFAPDDDPARGQVYVALARVHFLRNEPEAQEAWADKAQALAERLDDLQLLADAAHERATAAGHRGRLRLAIERLTEALALREAQGWGRAIALTLGELALLQSAAGQVDAAVASFERALALTEHPVMRDWLTSGLAGAYEHGGRVAEAWATLDARRAHVEAQGSPLQRGQMLHVEARCLLRQGRVADAEERLREVMAIRERVGVPSPSAALELGLILLSRDALDEAEQELARFDASKNTADFLHGTLAARCLLLARRGAWDRFGDTIAHAEIATTEWANDGLVEVWRLAADAARRAGRPDLASRALAQAAVRARWCGDTEAADAYAAQAGN